MKKSFALIISLLLVFTSSAIVFADTKTDEKVKPISWEEVGIEQVDYPISPENPIWKTFETHQEMVEACSIPEAILKNMNTDVLVKLVMEYPLLGDIYAFDNIETGFDIVASRFNGLSELMSRKDCAEKLTEYYRLLATNKSKSVVNLEKDEYFQYKENIKPIVAGLIFEKRNVLESLTEKQIGSINNSTKMLTNGEYPHTTATVKTPKGSSVAVKKYLEDLTAQEKAQQNAFFKNLYPNATYVSTSTNKYNCHSYAFYSQSTSNIYWMPDPIKYITDGSYKRVGTSPTANGQKIVYSANQHSGVVTNYSSNWITSKWGAGPLMRHSVYYSPYDGPVIYYKKG